MRQAWRIRLLQPATAGNSLCGSLQQLNDPSRRQLQRQEVSQAADTLETEGCSYLRRTEDLFAVAEDAGGRLQAAWDAAVRRRETQCSGQRGPSAGPRPPTVCASVTALYLSQNNLRSLEGIEQFAAVRLLSVGGNLIASDKEVARLNELAQLRNLNLMGNPLCDQPNYRLRVVAALKKLQVLDNTDITKKEREAAPTVAAQDDALRTMATQNHFDIQKVQRIAKLIALHKEFYGRVMAGVASGRFDRVPSPNGVACNVKLLLRLWRYEDTLSEQEQEALKVQMLTIIIRTHAKLAENPKVKAKEYLLKLANGSSPRGQRLDGASNDIKQRCASWEEAYANVIALQQKTIANLHALCEKNRREMVEFLKDLLSMDPRQRNQLVGGQRAQQHKDELEMKPPPRQVISPRRSWAGSRYVERQRSHDSFDAHSSQHHLPPQQQDPDARDRKRKFPTQASYPPPPMLGGPLSPRERSKSQATEIRHSRAQETTITNRTANLRSGDFANKSLGEAIHTFKLRDSQAVPRAEPSAAIPLPTKIPQVHTIYTAQRQDNVILPLDSLKSNVLRFTDVLVSNVSVRVQLNSRTR